MLIALFVMTDQRPSYITSLKMKCSLKWRYVYLQAYLSVYMCATCVILICLIFIFSFIIILPWSLWSYMQPNLLDSDHGGHKPFPPTAFLFHLKEQNLLKRHLDKFILYFIIDCINIQSLYLSCSQQEVLVATGVGIILGVIFL